MLVRPPALAAAATTSTLVTLGRAGSKQECDPLVRVLLGNMEVRVVLELLKQLGSVSPAEVR
jgi:hypothetical protein